MNQQTTIQTQTKPDHGATNAGGICLLIGCVAVGCIPLLGWALGAPLFLVAFILSIVAMAKNNIAHGIVLLLCTITLPWVAQFIGAMFFILGSIEANKPQTTQTAIETPAQYNARVASLDYGMTEAERQAAARHKRAK